MTVDGGVRRASRLVIALNLAAFAVEIVVALAIGSVSLLADSVDFLEDASLNLLVLAGLGWAPAARARLGMALTALLVAPAVAFAWTLWGKLAHPSAPAALALGLTGAAALAVNVACAVILARRRGEGGALTRAAFLSARNDVLANLAIIGAAVATAFTHGLWPDVAAGAAIAALNLGAARTVWRAARAERLALPGA